MTDQSEFDDDRNNPHAQRLIRVLERFAEICEQRTDGESGKLIDRESKITGETLNQKPERFVEENLVEPIATDVLGYDIRFQPKGFNGLGEDIPDFTILNLEAENFGEVKGLRMAEKAIDDSVKYLNRAVERPLVGIATDGLSWILYTAGKDEEPTYRNHERIYMIFKRIRLEKAHRQAARRRRPVLRKSASKFVNEFHIERLRKKVRTGIDGNN